MVKSLKAGWFDNIIDSDLEKPMRNSPDSEVTLLRVIWFNMALDLIINSKP
jgi:hypothetical protein